MIIGEQAEEAVHLKNDGEKQALKCVASGQPVPTLTWKRNGIVIKICGHYFESFQ